MSQPAPGFKFKRVMVVDDASIDRFLVERIVKKTSFAEEVLSFESAKDALEGLSQTADTAPQVIFLDINMPGMNGFEFLTEFEKFPDSFKQDCSVVMLTSSLHPDDKLKAAHNPRIKCFLNKPLKPEYLINLEL
ncbi:response regulator [Polluticoccus soli]|uniref:response regulator n=1 Tax=Polluticoccus soli TaxID=3034150 RepID=UPI0023E31380|nr:response regulator [Flavipsychrobacter sp. JY13-12]